MNRINKNIIGAIIAVTIAVVLSSFFYFNVVDPVFWHRHLEKLLATPTREGNIALTCSNMIALVQDGSITSYWTCGEHNHTWWVSGMGTHVEFTFFYDGREGPYAHESWTTSLFSEIQGLPHGSLTAYTESHTNILFISLLHARNKGSNVVEPLKIVPAVGIPGIITLDMDIAQITNSAVFAHQCILEKYDVFSIPSLGLTYTGFTPGKPISKEIIVNINQLSNRAWCIGNTPERTINPTKSQVSRQQIVRIYGEPTVKASWDKADPSGSFSNLTFVLGHYFPGGKSIVTHPTESIHYPTNGVIFYLTSNILTSISVTVPWCPPGEALGQKH